MCDGGEEVEYRLVCRRTGEVVGMAYIRPQEEANLHNLLLGPEEKDVKKEVNIEESEKTVDNSETTNSASEGNYKVGNVFESRQDLTLMAATMLEVEMQDVKDEPVKKESDHLGQIGDHVKEVGPRPGLRQGKGDLGRPGLFGWQREVVYAEHTRSVTGIHYITPPHPVTGLRRRCEGNAQIQAFLDISGHTGLTLDNFNVVRKELDLGKDFEVCRKGINPSTTFSIYSQFFEEVENTGNRSISGLLGDQRMVGCTFCGGTLVRYGNISHHMKKFHLPDETCPTCGKEIPATDVCSHKKTCKSKIFKGES